MPCAEVKEVRLASSSKIVVCELDRMLVDDNDNNREGFIQFGGGWEVYIVLCEG